MPIRVVLQAIEKGSILVDNAERYVSVRPGVVLYIAFLGDVDDTAVCEAVRSILSTKIFSHLSPQSTASLPLDECRGADILIIPQASLGGKIKGHSVQFHALVNKTRGAELYARFCQFMREARGVDTAALDANGVPIDGGETRDETMGRVVSGTYGNRQGLRIESEGPLTHFFDF